MTCAHCCDTSKFFDEKTARKEFKRYNKKGPTGTTSSILKALSDIPKKDKTLLDIGGGIGAIQWEFLKDGAKHATDVDAATGYIELARSIAKEYNYEDKTTFLQGDFNDVAAQLPANDFVTLDKVVCCYPDYKLILKNSTAKAKEYIALSYPISNYISRALIKIITLYFKLTKSEFRPYIHSTRKMEELIITEGFQLVHKSMTFPWNIRVYKRVT